MGDEHFFFPPQTRVENSTTIPVTKKKTQRDVHEAKRRTGDSSFLPNRYFVMMEIYEKLKLYEKKNP